MGRARDNAPVGYTCVMINEIISAIESVQWEETYWKKKELIELIENVRQSNITLRDWGNDIYNECEELQDEIDDLKREIEYRDTEIKELKFEIENLE